MLGDTIAQLRKKDKEDARQEGMEEGEKEGRNKVLNDIHQMLQNNCTLEDIRKMVAKEIVDSPA